MKLLFDQNMPPRLVETLASLYPESRHVFTIGLDRADDREIWAYAKHEAAGGSLRHHHETLAQFVKSPERTYLVLR